ncbi:hypothetical protein FA13DRAFT_1816632 [Coprinellus micaceus]|uniref:Mid2 domain-containing protein n=1 Tax=Coprinellus micaceus TaxID=71717 RepID=A0A4Y7SZZ2_COPMI|nr:hypothetical protein FA13DRAFT_1816632 [Coprinellus micaceus]
MASPTTATCPTAEWTLNSRGQSPCSIASTIAQACSSDGSFTLPPLPEEGGYHYEGPPATPSTATECRCNTVFYALQSACAFCQHPQNTFLRWSDYATNCSTTYEGLPIAIPSGVLIPAYAYLNVVTNDTFNIVLAQSPAFRDLDVAATSVRMLSSATAIPNLSANSDEGTHTSSSHDDDHDSSSPTHTATDDADSEQQVSSSSADKQKRAIVGGVVGAVCGLILIGGVIVYCLRRRRKQRIRSTPFRTVNTISHTTLPSPVATQEGTDRTDEKDASCSSAHSMAAASL